LNEGAAIGPLVEAVRRHMPQVLVVDDGSSDDTPRIAIQAGAEVLSQTRTQGKGAALQRGWKHVHQRGFAWALTLDGDGQHCPEDIPAFFACGKETSAALVIGNRMSEVSKMPWLRRMTNRWMSQRLSVLTGQALPDTQCGFRLVNLDKCLSLGLRTRHFEIESEVLLGFLAAGHRVEFVGIRTVYKSEHSKINPWKDAFRWWRWWQRACQSCSGVRRLRFRSTFGGGTLSLSRSTTEGRTNR
jgi:glycosyltransferase involved in cell wall biosynthesis